MRPARSLHRPRLAANRRGAIMVLASVLMVPLLCVAALSLDTSYVQLGATELQTTADATALAAARGFSLYPDSTPASTRSYDLYARQVAAANRVVGRVPTVDSVILGRWEPATRTFVGGGIPTNAVRTVVSGSLGALFGGVAGHTSYQLRRSAIAWVANVNSRECVKPFGMPYNLLYRTASSWAAYPAAGQDSLTQGMVSSPLGKTLESRTIVVVPPGSSPTPAGAENVANWQAMSYGEGASASFSDWRDWVSGSGCATRVTVADGSANLPGNGSNISTAATEGMATVCHRRPLQLPIDAMCYESATATRPGVRIPISWVIPNPSGTSGPNGWHVRVVGYFRVMCFYTSNAMRCGNYVGVLPDGSVGTYDPTLRGTGSRIFLRSYPNATMVGYAEGLTADAITSSTVLGTTIGDVQRVILVH